MNHVWAAVCGVAAAVLLNVVYRHIQSDWPQNYMSLTDRWSYVKAQLPARYILFRFGPVLLFGLFGGKLLHTVGWPLWPFVVAGTAAHAGPTSLRAAWRILRYRTGGNRTGPLVVLHVVTAAGVAVCLLAATLVGPLSFLLVADIESVRDGLWSGLAGSLLTLAFLRLTRSPEPTVADILEAQRQRVGREVVIYARVSARRLGLDADLVETVILVEAIQRPRWFRRLERLKGLIFRNGTYGIMQVESPKPIGDRASIDLALHVH